MEDDGFLSVVYIATVCSDDEFTLIKINYNFSKSAYARSLFLSHINQKGFFFIVFVQI